MPESLKDYTNRLLLARPYLDDENFYRSVVLIIEHTPGGSIGFVLNQAIENTMKEIMPDFPIADFPVFLGGPMENNTLHFIHVYGDILPGGELVKPPLCWGGDFVKLLELAAEGSIKADGIRFCVGYSGWGELQLEKEVLENAWVVGPEFHLDILKMEPKEMWRTILRSMGSEYIALANSPDNPSLN